MLPRKHRLRLKRDFERVFKKGRGYHASFFSLKFDKNEEAVTRVGFVVSNKISKKAVERNLIRRRLREVFRKYLPLIEMGYDITVIAKKEIRGIKYAELENELEVALKKARLLI